MTPRFLVYMILLLAALLKGLISYRTLPRSMRLLLLLLLAVVLSEVTGRLIALRTGSSMPVYHGLIPIQIVLYAAIYWRYTHSDKASRVLLIGLSGFCLLVSLFNSFYFHSIYVFPSANTIALSSLVVFLSMSSFYWMLKHVGEAPPWKEPLFWFNTGNLFFFSCTFFIFGFFNPLKQIGRDLAEWQYLVIWMANMVLYACYFMVFRSQQTKMAQVK